MAMQQPPKIASNVVYTSVKNFVMLSVVLKYVIVIGCNSAVV